MSFVLTVGLLCAGLFGGVLLAFELGRRIGLRRLAKEPSGVLGGTGVIEAAVLALLGLLIAFTFSGATSRFDARRQLIIDETNAISTAYLRLDLLLPDARPALRTSFRGYLDSRIETYRKVPDLAAVRAELARGAAIQAEIWQRAVVASSEAPAPAGMLLLAALNQMFDIANTRTLAAWIHPPTTIFVMLGALVLVASCFAGHSTAASKMHSWVHVFGFALVISVAVYVIVDIEYPRMGFIRVDAFDRALVELRQTMGDVSAQR